MAHDLSLPAAVLWDLDGTLVDTETAWIHAEMELAAFHGVEWTDADSEAMIGSALPRAAAIMRSRGVDLDDDAIIGFLIDRVLEIVGQLNVTLGAASSWPGQATSQSTGWGVLTHHCTRCTGPPFSPVAAHPCSATAWPRVPTVAQNGTSGCCQPSMIVAQPSGLL